MNSGSEKRLEEEESFPNEDRESALQSSTSGVSSSAVTEALEQDGTPSLLEDHQSHESSSILASSSVALSVSSISFLKLKYLL